MALFTNYKNKSVRPRIFLVAGQLGGGGAERQLALFLQEIRNTVDVTVLALNPGGVWEGPIRRSASEFHVCRRRSPPLRLLEICSRIHRASPDVLHSWHAYPFVYLLPARIGLRRPVVVNLRGDPTVHVHDGRAKGPGAFRLLRFTDRIVANSPHSIERLRDAGVALPRTTIVPNGIEVAPETTRPAPAVPKVVGIGSLRPLKNWEVLIEAVAALRESTPLELRIFGEGPARPELERLLLSRGLDPAASLPGYARDLRPELENATLLVHPSKSEGLPNAILEALAAGVPVLSSDLPICRDLARESGAVDLFDPTDSTGLTEALRRSLGARDDLRIRGKRGREHVASRYSPAAMARGYLDVYESCLTSHTT